MDPLKRGIRVVVCGPPHSGKSVFVQQLRRRLLPLGVVGVFEGCPDGEGGWAGATDQAVVRSLRKKGKFTPEFVSWVIKSVEQSPMPLTLIDVGGIRSPENERIFQASSHFIVLANPAKMGELEAWDAFGQANGCKPVALVESVLNGQTSLASDTGDGVVRGVQSNLERGNIVDGPVLDAIIARLLEVADIKANPGELEATVHTGRLADKLGIAADQRGPRMGFRASHAWDILYAATFNVRIARLWGACPAWVAALVSAGGPRAVSLWDIRLGWITIPELDSCPGGSAHLTWNVEEAEGYTHVSFSILGGVFEPGRLAAVCVPEIVGDKPIIISGRGPHWLVAAITRAYAKPGQCVAVAALHETSEPIEGGGTWGEANPNQAPAIVVAANENNDIGSVIPFTLPEKKT